MNLLHGPMAWGFLALALAGLSGLVTLGYRVMARGRRQKRLRQAQKHLEEAYEAGRIPEEFYVEHREILDGD